MQPVQQIQPTIGTGAVGGPTTGNSERLVPEIWAKELAEYRHDNLVLWALTDSRYSSEISQKGDILHINFLGEVDADYTTNFTVGDDAVVDNVEVDQVDLIVDRYIRHGLGIQDALKAQSAYELRAPITTRLARWLDTAKDAEVYKKAVADFANTISATGTNGTLAFADLVNAHALLDTLNVPESDRVLVLNGMGRGDLRKIPEFTAYKEVGEAGLVKNKTGLVGEIYGTPVYVTNVIKDNGDGEYDFLLFHKSAIISATQPVPRVESWRNARKGQDELIASELFGVKVLRPDHGIVIKRSVTAPVPSV